MSYAVSSSHATDLKLETVTCPLCGEAPSVPYHRENGYVAVRCDGCGLVFVRRRPTESSMKQLYEGQETRIDLARQIANVEGTTAEARRALDLITRRVGGGALLEIGCAAGYFLREAARRGFRPTGIDVTRQFVQFASSALGLHVIEGTLETAQLEPASFDVVYHRNVLSHLAWPVRSFAKMRALLRPRGWLVFQTGNVAELPASRWVGTRDLDLPDHLFHFGEPQIRRLLDAAGFDLVELRRYALLLHDAWARHLVRIGHAGRARVSSRAPSGAEGPNPAGFHPPTRAPRPRAMRRLAAAAEQLVTYGAGSAISARGRRCTLVVVARSRQAARDAPSDPRP